MTTDDTMLSAPEAAAYLGITRQRLNALVKNGQVAATRRGRYWWFKREDLDHRSREAQSVQPTTGDDLLSPGEAAQLLGVNRQRLTQLRERNILPAERHGNIWMYRRASIEQRLKEKPTAGRPK